MSHATHANAALTPRARLRLARLIVDQGWPIARAAERYDVSWRTAKQVGRPLPVRGTGRHGATGRRGRIASRTAPRPRWSARSCTCAGSSGSARSRSVTGSGCRPRPCTRSWCGAGSTGSPTSTAPPVSRSAATSTSTPATCSTWTSRSSAVSPTAAAGATSGASKAGRTVSATAARTGAPKSKYRQPLIGTCYLHTVIDDHSRVAYVEAHDDETKETATEVLRNAVAWFAARGVTVQRVLTDNGGCYRSYLWRDTCAELGITPKRTRPYRPQTNGKIERFHRTLVEGWAFKKFYNSESARLAALPAWVHEYNHHRPHSAIGKRSPITRLDNLAGHHT